VQTVLMGPFDLGSGGPRTAALERAVRALEGVERFYPDARALELGAPFLLRPRLRVIQRALSRLLESASDVEGPRLVEARDACAALAHQIEQEVQYQRLVPQAGGSDELEAKAEQAEARALDAGRLVATRAALRRVLARRKLAVSAEYEARIDASTDVAELERWHDQAKQCTEVSL
jgi:hypothetical protein